MEYCTPTYPAMPNIQPLIDICEYLSKAIKDTIPMKSFPRVYSLLRRHSRIAIASAKLMRDHLNACDQDCPDAPCLSLAAPSIRIMRDGLSIIVDLVNLHPLFFLERKPALKAYEAWDDLLDDCTIFSDPKIRETLLKMMDDSSKQAPSKDWRQELYDM